jgi:hypothetical protein
MFIKIMETIKVIHHLVTGFKGGGHRQQSYP